MTKLKKEYDGNFIPSKEYMEKMPDIQNSGFNSIPINNVGISNFLIPLTIPRKDGTTISTPCSINGSVSLDASERGINMSRIIRTLYGKHENVFDMNMIEKLLKSYKKDLDTFNAYIQISFKYPIWQEALRSMKDGKKEGGWQYYNIIIDANIDEFGNFFKFLTIDFVYSSACPCSSALSEYAGDTRGVYGIPHSQRSVARIKIDIEEFVWIEDLVDKCRETLTTETLVFCKRVDEMAFAEKNGADVKFVEDAIRRVGNMLMDMRLKNWKVICSHNESLHNHNAIAVMSKGGFSNEVSPAELNSMIY